MRLHKEIHAHAMMRPLGPRMEAEPVVSSPEKAADPARGLDPMVDARVYAAAMKARANLFPAPADMPTPRQRVIWITDWGFWFPEDFTQTLRALVAEDAKTPVLVAIDSGGGDVYGLLHILSAIKLAPVEIWTCVFGRAMSAAFTLLSAGAKGKRFAMPYAAGMMHEASGWGGGDVADMEARAAEYRRVNDLVLQILADNTGNDIQALKDELRKDEKGAGDHYFDVAGMVEFGVVDKVAENFDEVFPAAPAQAAPAADGGDNAG